MADHSIADPKSPVSPKVWAGLATGLAVAAIGGVISAVTPHTFDFLGPWGVIAYTAVTVGLAQLAAYLKRDPIRAVGAAAVEQIQANNQPTLEAPPAATNAAAEAVAKDYYSS